MTVGNITSSLLADNYVHSSNMIKLTPENKSNNQPLDLSKIDTVDLSREAIEKLAASKNSGIVMTPVAYPTSYGRFNEGGAYSTSVPVNFPHSIFDVSDVSLDDFVQKGVVNQDYVSQFDSILKDSNGNLKSGDNVLIAALNKYAELRSSISASNLPDAEVQIEQLENSLEWSVGTSLNQFACDMTQSNTFVVKSPTWPLYQ